jgi:hypothetical protein
MKEVELKKRTEGEQKAYLQGYSAGIIAGNHQGRNEFKKELRDLLEVPTYED